MSKQIPCFIFIIGSFLLSFSSCRKVKRDELKVTITVIEYKTDKPIANALVSITKGKLGKGYGTDLVATLTTNENGQAFYDEIVGFDYSYYAQARMNGYLDENEQYNLAIGEKDINVPITLYTESYVKLHVKNVNPFNMYDWIDVQSFCYQYIFTGDKTDTTFLWCADCNCQWRGNFEFEYAIGFNKNNIDSVQHIKFTPKPNDTITVNINY